MKINKVYKYSINIKTNKIDNTQQIIRLGITISNYFFIKPNCSLTFYQIGNTFSWEKEKNYLILQIFPDLNTLYLTLTKDIEITEEQKKWIHIILKNWDKDIIYKEGETDVTI
jgi:hypothetical protein